jgi:hypothetical protein
MSDSPTLMLQTADSSETSVHMYQTTWHHTPEDSNLQTQKSLIQDLKLCFLSQDSKHVANQVFCSTQKSTLPFPKNMTLAQSTAIKKRLIYF